MGGFASDLALAAISLGVRIQALMSSAESLLPTPSRGFLELPWPATAWHMVHLGLAVEKSALPFSIWAASWANPANDAASTTIPDKHKTRCAFIPCLPAKSTVLVDSLRGHHYKGGPCEEQLSLTRPRNRPSLSADSKISDSWRKFPCP